MTQSFRTLVDQSYVNGRADGAQAAAENTATSLVSTAVDDLTAQMTGGLPYKPNEVINTPGALRVFNNAVWQLNVATPGGLEPLGIGDGSLNDQALLVNRATGFAKATGVTGGYGGTLRTVTSAADDPTGTTLGTLRYHMNAHAAAWALDQTVKSWIVFSPGTYNITWTADVNLVCQNLTIDARGSVVNISGGGAPGPIPYGTLQGAHPAGSTVLTLNSAGFNFTASRMTNGISLDVSNGASTVYDAGVVVQSFDGNARTVTLAAPLANAAPSGATVLLAGNQIGQLGHSFFLGGEDWNTAFGPGKPNVAPGNIIFCNLNFASNWGGDVIDTGNAQDFCVRNWCTGVLIDHCSFTNPDPFHDVLINIGSGSTGVTFQSCHVHHHYKAINHFNSTDGSGGTDPDGTVTHYHSFPPGYSVNNPGPYDVAGGVKAHGNSQGLPLTREYATWHHCWFEGLGQRGPKNTAFTRVHLYNNLHTDGGLNNDQHFNPSETIVFPLPAGTYPVGGPQVEVQEYAELVSEHERFIAHASASGQALLAIKASPTGKSQAGSLRTNGNVYLAGYAPEADRNAAQVFTPTDYYPYTLDAPDSLLEARIRAGAGANAQAAMWTYVEAATPSGGGTVTDNGDGTATA